jgi:hypothetical protein
MQVSKASKEAMKGEIPPMEELYNYVYSEDGSKDKTEQQKFIRMPQYDKSIKA